MSEEAAPRKLTNKQRIFIDEYLRSFNATRAAIAAGYSPKTARSTGSENMTKPDIKAEIDAGLAEMQMTADEVKIRLADMARADIGSFLDVSTTGWNIDLLQRDEAGELIRDEHGKVIKRPDTKLIKKIKQKVTTIIGKKDQDDKEIIETEIELYDAQAALEKIGRHHKLFTDSIDVTSGGEKLEIVVKYATSDRDVTDPAQ